MYRELYEDLKEANPKKAKGLKLPGKQLKLIQRKGMLDKRVSELDTFLEDVVDIPEFLQHESTIQFLKDDCVGIEEM